MEFTWRRFIISIIVGTAVTLFIINWNNIKTGKITAMHHYYPGYTEETSFYSVGNNLYPYTYNEWHDEAWQVTIENKNWLGINVTRCINIDESEWDQCKIGTYVIMQ